MLLSSKSFIVELFHHLRGKYNITYLFTNRLNQDALEPFYGYMRAMEGANPNADSAEFKYQENIFRENILPSQEDNVEEVKKQKGKKKSERVGVIKESRIFLMIYK